MRKCNETEQENIFRYIDLEPEMNLFIYGDIENYGFHSDHVTLYVEDNGTGSYDSMVLQYFDFYIIYSQSENYALEPVINFFNTRTSIDCISGKKEIVERLVPYFPQFHLDVDYMCRCNQMVALETSLGDARIRLLTPEDARLLVELYLQIEEFADNYHGKEDKQAEQIKMNLENGGMAYGIFKDNQLVCAAQTSASNSKSAMIVGVASLPDYRGRGYAMIVLQYLCQAAFDQGKEFLCLFYNNPDAGRIYHRVGFEIVGQYVMFR